MSPQQLRGQEADARSDIFSFGVVLHEMLTGVHPFKKSTPMETANAILNEVPAALSRYMDEVPPILRYTARKMLAKEPDQRYQSVHEVRTDLRELAEDMGQLTGLAIAPEKKDTLRESGSAWRLQGFSCCC